MPDSAPDSHATKASLLLRIRDHGDADSWSDFAEVYGPLIRGYCRRKGLQEADSADVEQEVLAQVARSIAAFQYEPGRGRFRDWLGTVARNKIARFREKAAPGGKGGRRRQLRQPARRHRRPGRRRRMDLRLPRPSPRSRPRPGPARVRGGDVVGLRRRLGRRPARPRGRPIARPDDRLGLRRQVARAEAAPRGGPGPGRRPAVRLDPHLSGPAEGVAR